MTKEGMQKPELSPVEREEIEGKKEALKKGIDEGLGELNADFHDQMELREAVTQAQQELDEAWEKLIGARRDAAAASEEADAQSRLKTMSSLGFSGVLRLLNTLDRSLSSMGMARGPWRPPSAEDVKAAKDYAKALKGVEKEKRSEIEHAQSKVVGAQGELRESEAAMSAEELLRYLELVSEVEQRQAKLADFEALAG